MVRKANSHKALSKIGRSFRRSVSRRFVSFAGNKSPKTGRSPSSTGSIKRQYWNAFYLNGRDMYGSRIFKKSCTLFCEIIFSSFEEVFWKKSSSTEKEPHAEVKALTIIADMEETCGKVRKVNMLLSYSPCAGCAAAIIAFIQESPLLEISIAFSAVYHHDEKEHRQGLRRLNSEPRVTLRVFNENDWRKLAKETEMPYHVNLKRIREDSYWDYIFQLILTGSDLPQSLQTSIPIHPIRPVPFRPSQTFLPSSPVLPSSTLQPFQISHPRRPALPASAFQPFHPDLPSSPALPSSVSQPLQLVHSRNPVLPPSTSVQSQPAHPICTAGTSSSSQLFQPVQARSPVLPSSISQPFHPVRPNLPDISPSTSPVRIFEPQEETVLSSETSPTFRSIHPRHAIPPSRTFSSSYLIPPSSTSSFFQFCPSNLCMHSDTENDPTTPRERFAKLMRSKKFISFILFLVLLTVILAITLK